MCRHRLGQQLTVLLDSLLESFPSRWAAPFFPCARVLQGSPIQNWRNAFGNGFQGFAQQPAGEGDSFELLLPLRRGPSYELTVALGWGPDHGILTLELDGAAAPFAVLDCFSSQWSSEVSEVSIPRPCST